MNVVKEMISLNYIWNFLSDDNVDLLFWIDKFCLSHKIRLDPFFDNFLNIMDPPLCTW